MAEPARSDAALLDIRKALEEGRPLRRRLAPKLNAWIQSNVTKHERAKFSNFLLMAEHLGDVDLKKVARRVGVSKELLVKWMNTPEIIRHVNDSLNRGRRGRAQLVLGWARVLGNSAFTQALPLLPGDKIHPDGIHWDSRPMAKFAAALFDRSDLFRAVIDSALCFKECGSSSSAKRFFIDLGKCLSHGIRGTRGIQPELWNKLDVDIADIILCNDPPISDEDAVQELQNRGHWRSDDEDLPTLIERFGTRKHRLINDAHPTCKVLLGDRA